MLVINIPLHFINEDVSKGVKAGGIITHTMNQVEVRCQARNLPEFIEVDMTDVDMNDVVHLSSLKLPKNVELTIDHQIQAMIYQLLVFMHLKFMPSKKRK